MSYLKELAIKDNFNSIKVRLELPIHCFVVASHSSFQFHKGTIRTRKI